jgi:hypothetical protein
LFEDREIIHAGVSGALHRQAAMEHVVGAGGPGLALRDRSIEPGAQGHVLPEAAVKHLDSPDQPVAGCASG